MSDEKMSALVYRQVLDCLFDGVYCVDLDRKITYMNTAAQEISGYSSDEVLGKLCSCRILVHTSHEGRDLCDKQCPLGQSLETGQASEVQVLLHHKEGYRLPVITRSAPIQDETGRIIGAMQVFKTNANRARFVDKVKELQKEAFYDELTKVPNRRYGEKILQSRLQKLQNHPEYSFGVVLFDIDNFKRVNDRHGHSIGDQVLRMTAQTIANNLRPDDMVCRWGGEEFLVILEATGNLETPFPVADRLRVLVEKSFIVPDSASESVQLNVTVSGGVSMARTDDTIDSVFKRVDDLMYESKDNGKNCITVR